MVFHDEWFGTVNYEPSSRANPARVNLSGDSPAYFAKARAWSLDMGPMASPSVAPWGVIFFQRESDPPSPAKKYAPRWVRYKRVSCHLLSVFGKGLGNVTSKRAVWVR